LVGAVSIHHGWTPFIELEKIRSTVGSGADQS